MRDLYHMITGLFDDCTRDELVRLRSSINGRISKRKLTSEQARDMALEGWKKRRAKLAAGDGGAGS